MRVSSSSVARGGPLPIALEGETEVPPPPPPPPPPAPPAPLPPLPPPPAALHLIFRPPWRRAGATAWLELAELRTAESQAEGLIHCALPPQVQPSPLAPGPQPPPTTTNHGPRAPTSPTSASGRPARPPPYPPLAGMPAVICVPYLRRYAFSVGAGDAVALFYPIPVRRGASRVLVRRGEPPAVTPHHFMHDHHARIGSGLRPHIRCRTSRC